MCAQAKKCLGCISTDHTASQNYNLGRRNTGNTAEQNSFTTPVVLKKTCRDRSGDLAADLAERPQYRTSTVCRFDLLIGDRSDLLFEQHFHFVLPCGCKMQ